VVVFVRPWGGKSSFQGEREKKREKSVPAGRKVELRRLRLWRGELTSDRSSDGMKWGGGKRSYFMQRIIFRTGGGKEKEALYSITRKEYIKNRNN